MFAGRQEQLPAPTVDQHLLERFVQVERLAGDVLVVEGERTVLRPQRQGRVRVQHVVVDRESPAHRHPGLCLRHRPVEQAQFRVVAARNPGVAAAALHERQIAPGFAARFAGPGDGVRTPPFLARFRVVRRNEATLLVVADAAVDAVDHQSVNDDRTARVGVALRRIGDLRLPERPAAARVERKHGRVLGGDEDLVAPDREVAELVEPTRQVAFQPTPVLPDQRAGVGLQRLDDVARIGQVHDAVVNERRRLIHAVRHRPRPHQAQIAHVPGVDLVERAVTLAVVGAPEHQPVAWGRVEEHLRGDRFETVDLALSRRPDVGLLDRFDGGPEVAGRDRGRGRRGRGFPIHAQTAEYRAQI